MKLCKRCGVTRAPEEWGLSLRTKDGLQSCCKSCAAELGAAWYQKNKDRRRELDSAWLARNPDFQRERALRRRAENPAPLRAAAEAWRKKNPHKCAEYQAQRRTAATHANAFVIEEIYDLARRRTESTGIAWHVDHIVPLKSRLVCGLHSEHNLRVIPARVNQSKGNRHWPDMPEIRA